MNKYVINVIYYTSVKHCPWFLKYQIFRRKFLTYIYKKLLKTTFENWKLNMSFVKNKKLNFFDNFFGILKTALAP